VTAHAAAAQTLRAPGSLASPEHTGITPRAIASPTKLRDEALGRMRYLSPLRYPGAKSGLATVLAELIIESSKSLGRPQLFVEPFAGVRRPPCGWRALVSLIGFSCPMRTRW
jgi:hypothetical protein